LLSFALNKNISLKAFKTGQIERHFWCPLSIEASGQLEELQIMLSNIQTSTSEKDKWTYIWNSDEYFCYKGYLQIIGINDVSPIFQWMWKSCVMGRHKIFFWLLLRGRLNTRELLKRKNMELDDYNCVLCREGVEESLMHLFFECPFSKWCWRLVKVFWNISLPPNLMLIRSRC
jgi:hypothetical protein